MRGGSEEAKTPKMIGTKMNTNNPHEAAFEDARSREDWEDWENEDDLIDLVDPTETGRKSVQKPSRLKSRRRQKAQNAQAGIKLDTDLSSFCQPGKQKMRQTAQNLHNGITGRFMDAAALKALEGSPNPDSIGSFAWLDEPVQKSTLGPAPSISPIARKVPTGFEGPPGDLSEYQVSPQTPGVEPSLDMRYCIQHAKAKSEGPAPTPQQQQSTCSPDTEATESLVYGARPASSVYSQPSIYGVVPRAGQAPPVPALPARHKFKEMRPAAFGEPDDDDDDDDDDAGTPYTPFEEDGSPLASRRSFRPTQETKPFKNLAQKTGSSSAAAPEEWWTGTDQKKKKKKKKRSSRAPGLAIATPAYLSQQNTAQSSQYVHPNVVPAPSGPSDRLETQSEKARILLEVNQEPGDEPPPYSPLKAVDQVKYSAISPPPQVFNSQPIPSPGPISPSLPGTMTSQGAISMAEIPLTPRTLPTVVLPDRPVGTYLTEDHFSSASGTRHRVERQRRRHEKEEVVARKVGGFWRGRGCMPENGCFGRTGREGRRRRRICLALFGGILAAIILVVVLPVVLTRRRAPTQGPEHSIWLNLTDFPPMPTGVLTVAGPDNSESISGCLALTTAWSCSIPKDQQDPEALYDADQPEFIFQIQYDNNTQALWKVTDSGEQPVSDSGNVANANAPTRRTASSALARAADVVRRSVVYDAGFSPDPAPPSIAEMDFLGETTDGIVSDNKAGEPTPFYISFLTSINATVGPNMVMRRGLGNGIDNAPENGTSDWNLTDILPPPALKPDGTGAPATTYPLPSQQPVRLFDRGLPTEHYGFYTFFNKTIYLSDRDNNSPSDGDGGSLLSNANSLITWTETRFLVKMWTRMENTTQLLGNGTAPGTDGTTVHAKPGTMPYPVTVAEDLHGGDRITKALWYYGVSENEHINTTEVALIVADRGSGGTLVNSMNGDFNMSLGGIDGGTGGCKCEWLNFQQMTIAK